MKTEKEIRELTDSRFVVKVPKRLKIRPERIEVAIYGHHSSYVEDDFRVYGFEKEDGLNKFKSDYKLDYEL